MNFFVRATIFVVFCVVQLLFLFPAFATPKNMALIPAGKFLMGTNDRHEDEGPEHIAYTEAFYIDTYEVTNEDYLRFAKETKKRPPIHMRKELPEGKEKYPVVYVSWYDADAYCTWAGKRLPSEQEWEKAARGGDGRVYPWGNVFSPEKSNNPQKKTEGTEPVDAYGEWKNPYGLYNMSGNVWEWTSSAYLPHPGNTTFNPTFSREKKILKGGSWLDCLAYSCGISAPLYNRSYFMPKLKTNSFGFRCVQDL